MEDVRYGFVVERAEHCWEIRVNPYLIDDKGTRTDKHGQKSRILTDGQTGENGKRTNERICLRIRQKCLL